MILLLGCFLGLQFKELFFENEERLQLSWLESLILEPESSVSTFIILLYDSLCGYHKYLFLYVFLNEIMNENITDLLTTSQWH